MRQKFLLMGLKFSIYENVPRIIGRIEYGAKIQILAQNVNWELFIVFVLHSSSLKTTNGAYLCFSLLIFWCSFTIIIGNPLKLEFCFDSNSFSVWFNLFYHLILFFFALLDHSNLEMIRTCVITTCQNTQREIRRVSLLFWHSLKQVFFLWAETNGKPANLYRIDSMIYCELGEYVFYGPALISSLVVVIVAVAFCCYFVPIIVTCIKKINNFVWVWRIVYARCINCDDVAQIEF